MSERDQLSLLMGEELDKNSLDRGVGLDAISKREFEYLKFTAKNADTSLIGQRFHSLLVLSYHGSDYCKSHGKRCAHWLCKCDCGSDIIVSGRALKRGDKRSCGCLSRRRNDPNRQLRVEKAYVNFFSNYRSSAKSRGLEFKLSEAQFREITSKDCFYCGVNPVRRYYDIGARVKPSLLVNGIDRIDSDKGYVLDNCVPCCKQCNLAKRDMPILDFIHWLDRITTNMNRLNEYSASLETL